MEIYILLDFDLRRSQAVHSPYFLTYIIDRILITKQFILKFQRKYQLFWGSTSSITWLKNVGQDTIHVRKRIYKYNDATPVLAKTHNIFHKSFKFTFKTRTVDIYWRLDLNNADKYDRNRFRSCGWTLDSVLKEWGGLMSNPIPFQPWPPSSASPILTNLIILFNIHVTKYV